MVSRGHCLHSKVMGQAGGTMRRLKINTGLFGADWLDHVAIGVKRVNWKLKVSLLKEEVAKLVHHPEALWAGGEEYVDDELM